MNEYELERKSQRSQHVGASEPKVLDRAVDKDQDEIELQINQLVQENGLVPNEPLVNLQTNLESVPTDQDLVNGPTTDRNGLATDRKLVNDLKINNEQNELSDHLKNGTELFPKKDDDEIFAEGKPGCCRPWLVILRRFILHLGALVSFLNFIGDLLYFFKAPFFDHWMWPMIGFLSARYLICIILGLIWMKSNEQQKTSSEVSQQKMTFLMVVVEFFSDLGGLPVVILLGLYRVLPVKHFSREIKIGYAIEVCTSLIPIFLICLMNNSNNQKELSWLIVSQFTLRLVAIVNFGFEVIIVIKQIINNAKLRQQLKQQSQNSNSDDFEALKRRRSQEKIQVYGKRVAWYTIASIIVSTALLVLGFTFIEGRTCEKGNALYWGMCQPCLDSKCMDCQHLGPNSCSACQEGYHADTHTGICSKCDSDPDEVMCRFCKMPNEAGVADCIECATGFHLNQETKQCVKCEETTGVLNCGQCSRGECSACATGYFFQELDNPYLINKKTCVKCSSPFEFCDQCSESKCVKCQESIATFDDSGSGLCRQCTAPWVKAPNGGWPECQCPHIIDLEDNYACKTCSQTMPGCNKCEYASQNDHFQLGKQVGWDPMLSGQSSSYVGPDKSLSPSWILCTEGDNMKAVNVVLNQTHQELQNIDHGDRSAVQAVISSGLVQPEEIEIVRQCDAVIDGCSECKLEETQVTCNKCQSGYHIEEASSQNFLYAVLTYNQCKKCGDEFGENCLECSKFKGCTKCNETYRTIDGQKGCFKCMYEWQCDNN